MHLEYRKKPYSILAYEALFRQLKPGYRNNEFINIGYLKESAGYRGERDVDYKLSLYPLNNCLVIQGLRLRNGPHYFQIDTLILTPSFFQILEIKNIKGILEYDSDFNQLIQRVGTEVKGIKNPIFQAEAQQRNLESFLQSMKIFAIPIEYLVVISDPRTVLKCKQQNQEVFNKMIHAESIPIFLDKAVNQHQKEILTKTRLKKICNYFLKNHIPHLPHLLKKHNLNEQHLIKGIPCPGCQHSPMERAHHTWTCVKCSTSSKNAHERLIFDYFLLNKNTITNKECRNLLQTPSVKVAYRILNSMGLSHSGEKKGRKYHSPSLEDYPQDSLFPLGIQSNSIW
ncbi:nuclease-related domain-containing protein [Virgibacillus phasianinus]|uniref:nuclease-related domain-containing protein n=1 Tax=Virgibacillus phasianinus TaxID=2017483 RepID=UPI0012FE0285|nr:nuclease-related domain-containing protein [Virgibacillus phasianinus]